MSEFRTATRDDYRCLHPDNDTVPPLLTDDGHITAIGTAHGRTIPVIGSTRPPVFDASLHPYDGSNLRVYADDPDDVLAIMGGTDYQKQLTLLRDLSAEYDQLAEGPEEDARRTALATQFRKEVFLLCLMRGSIAHRARAVAQGHINDKAKESGAWDTLTDEQQRILTEAADTTSDKAPIGQLKRMTIINPDYPDSSFVGDRGTWTADVPLVVNDADYYPWTNVPSILSITTVTGPDGAVYEDDTSDLNLRHIRVDDAEVMLDDMNLLQALDLTVRTILPVDPIYRDGYAEAVDKRLAANRAATATN